MLISSSSAERENSSLPFPGSPTSIRLLPEISPLLLKFRYPASHDHLPAERSFLGRLPRSPACRGLREEEPLKLGTAVLRCPSLTAFITNNISWRQSFLGNKSDGHCNLRDIANMWALRTMFSWLQTWKPTLPWDFTTSPRTKQTCCLVNAVSFPLQQKLLLNTNRILLDWRELLQIQTQQKVKVEACSL